MSAIDALTPIKFVVGTMPNRKVVIDFRRVLSYIELTPEDALQLAEGLIEAASDAAKGRHIITGTDLNPG